MNNHYGHNVDVTIEPFICSDCDVALNDDGTTLE
jgi:hypothetical protein